MTELVQLKRRYKKQASKLWEVTVRWEVEAESADEAIASIKCSPNYLQTEVLPLCQECHSYVDEDDDGQD